MPLVVLVVCKVVAAALQDCRHTGSNWSRFIGLFQAARAKALFEAVDTATGLGNFLAAGIERVTCSAHVQVDVLAQSGASDNNIAAAAFGSNFGVLGMNIGFHV
jgi:hypothetical protein